MYMWSINQLLALVNYYTYMDNEKDYQIKTMANLMTTVAQSGKVVWIDHKANQSLSKSFELIKDKL